MAQIENLQRALQGEARQYIPGVSQIEDVFTAIGLGSGPFAPAGRFAAGFLATAAIQKLAGNRFAPWAYGPDDVARPWKYTHSAASEEDAANATSFPWFALPVIVGTVTGGLI